MGKSFLLNDALAGYVTEAWMRETDVLRELREETAKMEESSMQIAADQGQFMAFLVKLTGAKKCLEVGVFTGYSSTAVALALPEGGRLTACDISEEFTSVARRYWKKAGVEEKIDLVLGPATETLDGLVAGGNSGTYDFAFIDADKPNYVAYYERVLSLLRKGGLVLIDNVLWDGKVADLTILDEQTLAIRQFNEHVHRDDRVDLCLVPIGDGVTMARKR
jgi:predicted O-methyltransferase YrrM